MRYRFGSWSFDTETRRLERNGAPVHLTPKAFDLLTILIEDAPRVVPKSELHERLWPAAFVSDATLTGLVKEIRRALGETDTSSFIRTAHRVGYAFAGKLEDPAAKSSGLHWLTRGTERIPLVEGSNVIGRDPDSTIWIDVPGVSRRHACVVVDGVTVTLEDLGSKNGTQCGEEQIAKAVELRNDDRIHIAGVELIFHTYMRGTLASTESQVEPGGEAGTPV